MSFVVLTWCVRIISRPLTFPPSVSVPPLQLEALKQQNSKYQEELSLLKELSSSENQRFGVLCKEL